MKLPTVEISPSKVARSILMGMFGLNHRLIEIHAATARGLVDGTEGLTLPADLALRLSLVRGRYGRLVGPMSTSYVSPMPPHTMTHLLHSQAAVYFPPLAWQLTWPGGCPVLDSQGWVDVSGWLARPLAERVDISTLIPALPVVYEATRDPALMDGLCHFFSDSDTPIVETSGLGL